MSAPASTAALAQPPDPRQDQAHTPARTARLRHILRKLIAHAEDLTWDLTRRPTGMAVLWITVRFASKDIPLILARITRGLRLAAALHATLPRPQREHQRENQREQPAQPAPAERKRRTRPTPQSGNHANPGAPIALPTSKEIAAQLRNRPIGEILTEICLALGILTTDPLWRELESVLLENGADCDRIAQDSRDRIDLCDTILPPDFFPSKMQPPQPAPAPEPAGSAPAATGPP